jgi:RNA-directed DNA polymerase
MTADNPAGAASLGTVDWHAIDWRKAHRNVRWLQARIVKAAQEGRWGKVKALQRLLTHSFSGKALAVKRVTENQGKNTPGVDQVLWNTPRKKGAAVGQLRQRGYHPQPLRRVYIPKSSNPAKLRPLGIPTLKDRAMQALYLLALDPVAETTADPNSFGFRHKRSTADAIGQCFLVLAKADRAQWILEGDIRACFDQISHEWLLAHIPIEKNILRKWLQAGYMELGKRYPTEAGTPQGGILSPVLANLALDGLQETLRKAFPRLGRSGPSQQVNLARFADDFIVTGRSRELLEDQVKPIIVQFLAERGLELSLEKTHITHIAEGFDFLGQNVRKYKGTPLIKPAKKNQQAFLDKVRRIIHKNRQNSPGQLIVQLNPLIRGWANYHRHVVSSKAYRHVDHVIFGWLWRWARRRHPRKGKRWVKDKYFPRQGTRNWVFSGEVPGKQGKLRTVRLVQAAQSHIRRHVKIIGKANPYDPAWELYFEQRLDEQLSERLEWQRTALNLWKSQEGKCPVCGVTITLSSGWHSHHIVWQSKGGTDTLENRVLLHPNCHRQVHVKGLSVEKPRPHTRGVGKA